MLAIIKLALFIRVDMTGEEGQENQLVVLAQRAILTYP